MADLQYASCLDNLNHTEAGRALPSIWTLSCCQNAQKIVRYPVVGQQLRGVPGQAVAAVAEAESDKEASESATVLLNVTVS
ncbi:hypothetical protein [Collinsella intestinalis]|uniref:hypothetical protein n=1 Tax=Collinsella intestinalis TaxID=147207 RepID=UPI0012EC8D9F|nr:hypothetical protein [Collinsella intestinalis]